jgi:hypothetical protein
LAGKFDKVILTNLGALQAKYPVAGARAIKSAVTSLITADRARGLTTCLIAVDDAAAMKKLGTAAVTNAFDPAQNKVAVDGVYRAFSPDYLMILGSSDVIPHQDLKNPLYTSPQGDDPDPIAYGDLPYACEAPYSQAPQNFMGPTRVVGRLPDITGGSDPSYLVGLLATAANWTSAGRNTTSDYFAVAAQIWHASTELSTTNIFGNAQYLEDVPPSSFQWSQSVLSRRMHFFNCHGASQSSQFYGQPASGANEYPPALDAAYINGKINEGAVAAAEACYGGQLYAVSAAQRQIGICNTYLANKAHGFFGSTTIAYGPASGNGQADLICQFFLERVLAGSSLGRAALEARQRFIQSSSPPDPSDVKTIAQFNLYADPSITPFQSGLALAVTGKSSRPADQFAANRIERQDRRRFLFRRGLEISTNEPTLTRRKGSPRGSIRRILWNKARELGFNPTNAISFGIKHRKQKMPKGLTGVAETSSAYHVVFARRRKETPARVADIMLVIGKEVDGKIISVNTAHSR